MKQINPTDYHLFLQQAEAAAGDFVYPRSIAEGRQSGEIYTHGDAVLFHHFCGFAYLSGNPEQAFLEKIRAQFFDNPAPNRRFLLIPIRRMSLHIIRAILPFPQSSGCIFVPIMHRRSRYRKAIRCQKSHWNSCRVWKDGLSRLSHGKAMHSICRTASVIACFMAMKSLPGHSAPQ